MRNQLPPRHAPRRLHPPDELKCPAPGVRRCAGGVFLDIRIRKIYEDFILRMIYLVSAPCPVPIDGTRRELLLNFCLVVFDRKCSENFFIILCGAGGLGGVRHRPGKSLIEFLNFDIDTFYIQWIAILICRYYVSQPKVDSLIQLKMPGYYNSNDLLIS